MSENNNGSIYSNSDLLDDVKAIKRANKLSSDAKKSVKLRNLGITIGSFGLIGLVYYWFFQARRGRVPNFDEQFAEFVSNGAELLKEPEED